MDDTQRKSGNYLSIGKPSISPHNKRSPIIGQMVEPVDFLRYTL
jgi:hypothetical protein